MAAVISSSADSRELSLAAVAHLSRYRGTSREHTESDLRVFFNWRQHRQLAPLDAQRNDLELYCGGCRTSGGSSLPLCPADCPSLPAFTGPASSTVS